jgi:hypothetical protein
MTIYELAEIYDKSIIIKYCPKRKPPFYAHLEKSDIKKDIGLLGEHGNGYTPNEAIRDYAKKIRGERIVFNGLSDKYREEFNVPEGLE